MEARKVPSKALLSTPTKRQGLVSSLLPSSPRNGGRDLAAKWGPARKVLTATRIPSRPCGKENVSRGGVRGALASRGRGARVVRPVQRPKHLPPPAQAGDRTAPTVSRSPNTISCRRVPDLHARILAKIRAGKSRGGRREVAGPEVRKEQDEDCPVQGEEVQRYLASVFSICDIYGTGTVRAAALLHYLTRLVATYLSTLETHRTG